MFCGKCGQSNGEGNAFCVKCGTQMAGGAQQVSAAFPPPVSSGSGFSTAGIVCGAVSFLFFPIILGPAGLILGAIGKSKGEAKAVVAMAVSGVGLVVGMILGAYMWGTY